MEAKTEKQKDYEAQMLKVIKEKKIKFFEHAFAYLPFAKRTAENHDLHKMHTIKDAINENKVSAKDYMLSKWVESDNATLNISAYRLLSDSEEHQKLNQSYVDHTTKGKEINEIKVNIVDVNGD